MAEVKFCGLTRADDARAAAALGAAYVGVVFAGGPRRLASSTACAVLDGAAEVQASGNLPRRVGVFGEQSAGDIADAAEAARLDVIQLHGPSDDALVAALRTRFDGQLWRVIRVGDDDVDTTLRVAGRGVDGVVVDALVDGVLGGTGVAVNWERLARALERVGRPARLVLAGGLNPLNVARAIGLVDPDVVDVSSGVESELGIKDHDKMRAFAVAAARGGR